MVMKKKSVNKMRGGGMMKKRGGGMMEKMMGGGMMAINEYSEVEMVMKKKSVN